MTLTETVKSFLKKPLIYLSTVALLTTACYTQPIARDVELKQKTEIYQEGDNNRTFIGRPLTLTNNGDDLEFLLKAEDEQTRKSLYITVHEDADFSNKKNLELVESWIRESREDPDMTIKVQGFYKPDKITPFYEEGSLDPYIIIKMTENDGTGAFEEAVWTDKKDSPIYTDIQVNIVLDYVYYPGHHIWLTHYPLGFSPYWDNDGDGIPNRWDLWPNVFGPWVDLNHNHIWDWYDPFYSFNEVPYWGYWHNHYSHHNNFIFEWQKYYGNNFKNHHDFRERNREVTRIRNDLGGRNPGNRDPIIKRDPINERDQIKNRDKIQDRNLIRNKNSVKERNPIKNKEPIRREKTIDDKVNTREKEKKTIIERDQYKPIYKQQEEQKRQEQIDKDRSPPIKRQEVERKTYEKQKETQTYTPPKTTYQTPKRETRTYTPPQRNTHTPRVTTPRNNTPPRKETEKSKDKK